MTFTTLPASADLIRIVVEVELAWLDDLAERLDDIAWACRGEWQEGGA